VFRIDNAGEFCGKEFDQLCKQCGIACKNPTPYTPKQNGFSERMNKTLMDKERSMLSGLGLAQEFWVEAVGTTKYLVNMSHSLMLVDMTPHEVWSDKNPSAPHLKLFGYDAFMHVPKEKGSKLDKKEFKFIFIGYKEGMKGYNIWDHASMKTVYI
jgi:transposase InsO family protein